MTASNRRPDVYDASALPTELTRRHLRGSEGTRTPKPNDRLLSRQLHHHCGTLPNSQRKWERSTDLTAPNGALYQLSYTLIMNLFVVGVAEFESATPCAQSKCSTRLSYTPLFSGSGGIRTPKPYDRLLSRQLHHQLWDASKQFRPASRIRTVNLITLNSVCSSG